MTGWVFDSSFSRRVRCLCNALIRGRLGLQSEKDIVLLFVFFCRHTCSSTCDSLERLFSSLLLLAVSSETKQLTEAVCYLNIRTLDQRSFVTASLKEVLFDFFWGGLLAVFQPKICRFVSLL